MKGLKNMRYADAGVSLDFSWDEDYENSPTLEGLNIDIEELKEKHNTEKELYQKLCDFNHYNTLSGSEKKVFDALMKLSANYRWKMYLALHQFIDGFLF